MARNPEKLVAHPRYKEGFIQRLLKNHLHEDVGAVVGRWLDAGRIEVAEADGFVEVDGVGQPVVGLEVEAARAELRGFGDGVFEDGAADAGSA